METGVSGADDAGTDPDVHGTGRGRVGWSGRTGSTWAWSLALVFAVVVTIFFVTEGLLRNLWVLLPLALAIWIVAGWRWQRRLRKSGAASRAWARDPFPWAVLLVVLAVAIFGRQPGAGFAVSRGALETRAQQVVAEGDSVGCFPKGDGAWKGLTLVGALPVEIESCLALGEVRFKTSVLPRSLTTDRSAGRVVEGYVYRTPEARSRPLDEGFCDYTRIDDAFSKFSCFFEGFAD